MVSKCQNILLEQTDRQGVNISRCYDDFFDSFMFSYLHLLRRHSRNGMPSDGKVITANAAQSSWLYTHSSTLIILHATLRKDKMHLPEEQKSS